MLKTVLLFFLICLAAIGCEGNHEFTNVREALLSSARQSYRDFPDGKETKLTTFAYIGHSQTVKGPIHVVNFSRVITGMLAPRGFSAILFFDKDYNFLGSEVLNVPALWCHDGKVFLYGRTSNQPQRSGGKRSNGSAIDLSQGWENRKLVDICEYGSSGGIEDQTPSEEERLRERMKWDSK